MKHSNISIFVPHIGCPNMCSFCNQHTISGTEKAPTAEEVRETCKKALGEVKSPSDTEIAFFGGSFTAIPEHYMVELLESAQGFIGDGKFKGIRISTRPDCINRKVLDILKKYNVTSIELGAQSMNDKVLHANDRGHTAQDVVNSSRLIREYGFELGLQMMIGLYKSSGDDEFETVSRIIDIHPDTVRIYPVVILKGTKLAELYLSGEYEFFCGESCGDDFENAVALAAQAMEEFENNGIRVIKVGLHASEFVKKDMVGGFYHPAFRELCESLIYRNIMEEEIAKASGLFYPQKYVENEVKTAMLCGEYVFIVNSGCVSKALGHKKSNYAYFKSMGITIKIIGDENIPKYKCELRR